MRIDKRKIIMSVVVVLLGLGVYGIRLLQETRSGAAIQSYGADTEPQAGMNIDASVTPGEDSGKESETEECEVSFPVYICGAVNRPGVYMVSGEIFLYEMIDLAGGLSAEADRENIDMVYRIDHSQSLFVPFSITSETTRLWNDFPDVVMSSWVEGEASLQNNMININLCGKEELCTLPGIGEKTAEKIINYRQEHGLFKRKEDICQVPGIGSSKYAAIEAFICI